MGYKGRERKEGADLTLTLTLTLITLTYLRAKHVQCRDRRPEPKCIWLRRLYGCEFALANLFDNRPGDVGIGDAKFLTQ